MLLIALQLELLRAELLRLQLEYMKGAAKRPAGGRR